MHKDAEIWMTPECVNTMGLEIDAQPEVLDVKEILADYKARYGIEGVATVLPGGSVHVEPRCEHNV